MTPNILYESNKSFIEEDGVRYPVTHMFVVGERSAADEFKIIVYGEGGANKTYI